MKILLKNVKAVLPEGETLLNVYIEDGIIKKIGETEEKADVVRDCGSAFLMPGFIDIHNHGGLSKAFFDETADLEAIMKAYAKRGTTAILPTYSCMPENERNNAFRRMAEFAKTNKRGAKVPGIHSEGPFLNPVRAGGMYPEYMVKPDIEYFNRMAEACGGLLRIITLAPEMDGADKIIKAATESGVLVSAGHTDATYDEMESAVEKGVTRLTHTFNAMRPLNHREPGVLGAALTDERVNCEMICDFAHLNPAAVKLIIKSKGIKGVSVISDYSDKQGKAAKGEGEHEFEGVKYTIRNGVAWSLKGGVMANSNDMLVSVKNLYSIGISPADIAVMASENPAKAAGIFDKTGSIEVGKAADLVLLDNEFNLIDSYVDGVIA